MCQPGTFVRLESMQTALSCNGRISPKTPNSERMSLMMVPLTSIGVMIVLLVVL